MTSKERFMCALKGGQPDRVPVFDFVFSQYVFEQAIKHRPDDYNSADAIEAARVMSLDGVWIPFGGFSGFKPRFLAENIYVDEWGTTYKKDLTIAWPIDAPIDYPIKNRQDLKAYKVPDPTATGRLDALQEAKKLAKGEIAVLGGVQAPLTTAWLIYGAENIMIGLFEDPQLVEDIFKISNEFFIEAGRQMFKAGLVDGLIVSEDLGHSSGPFFSLEHFRKHLRPYLEEMISAFVNMGIPVLLHSCGNINIFLDDLVEIGITGLHAMQRTARMNLAEIKRKYGSKISLVGNIDSSVTLPYGTEEEVEQEVIEALRVAAPDGGYILASDHSLHDGIPMSNIWKMIETGKKYGHYPLSLPPKR